MGLCRLPISWPVFLASDTFFCLVDISGFQLEMSFVQLPSWCLATTLACFRYFLLSPRIHDVTPLAGSTSSSGSSCGTLERGVAVNVLAAVVVIFGAWRLPSVASSSGSFFGVAWVVAGDFAACAVA